MASPADNLTQWTTEPDHTVSIKVGATVPASYPPVTLNEAFKDTVTTFLNRPALKVKRNGEWSTWDYNQYSQDVIKAAKSMIKIGLDPHHGAGILGFNSPEWFISYT
jgi:long-chain-fatty-acid--CoA ligase ACSBG